MGDERDVKFTIAAGDFDAVLFDLDGVVTRTARVHAAAWKELFDGYLESRDGPDYEPFDIERDYAEYVDGKPRYDGVASFLASRGIDLPRGSPDDPPDAETVCGLGNRKNRHFLGRLRRDGVEVWPDAPDLLRALRAAGLKTAIVTSSANGKEVVETAGLADLFDARVDGVVSDELDLEGKPAPDIFEEAARRVEATPARAVVVEDAVSGVRAGDRGRFGAVVGVDRTGHAEALREGGADVVVSRLSEVRVRPAHRDALDLPSALEHVEEILDRLGERGTAVFLDYDGTLTPIVERPEDALLPAATRKTVARLARRVRVAIVSGRDRPDVTELVGVEGLWFAGSHGFDIAGPDGERFEVPEAAELLPALDAARKEIADAIAEIPGARIENKRFAVTVHYRQVADDDLPRVEAAVDRARDARAGLRKVSGKKVHELQPDVPWNKGRALLRLLGVFEQANVVPLYLGDDTTDEDAFRAIEGRGIGIVVADESRDTSAEYRLADPGEVERFLSALAERREDEERRWTLIYDGFDPEEEGLREALTTLGNGYFATRGAAPHASADGVHYPGTYLAGGYDRAVSRVAGRDVENEDLVNLPNWLLLSFRPEGGEWLDFARTEFLEYRQSLDLRRGILSRRARFRDGDGRETKLEERRFVHMGHAHLAGVELRITPENWSGPIEVRSALDGRVTNAGVARYSELESKHLVARGARVVGGDTMSLEVETAQSGLRVALAARTRIRRDGETLAPRFTVAEAPDHVAQTFAVEAAERRPVVVEKVVALYTSRDRAISEPELEARTAVGRTPAFADLIGSHALAWEHLWDRFDVELVAEREDGGARIARILHLYLFHLLQTTSIHVMTMGLDVGVPSRGWHGEAYRGHVFWDELFIFPILNFRIPEVTRALLLYRYRRLEAARIAAREAGYEGAMFPWQSGSNGREESQVVHLNPKSGNWIPDLSRRQRHVNAAIAYNVFRYWQVTEDREFLAYYGAEMVIEIARFWASIAEFDEARGRWVIRGVMGPDEYHDRYPDSDRPGLDDNAYTNVMASWVLRFALEALDTLPADRRTELAERLRLGEDETAAWRRISRNLFVPFLEHGVIEQFDGYRDLEEFDWEGYREKVGDIQRLDRVLEAEDDTPNRYKASKQADVLMLFYLFSADELRELFAHLGYEFSPDAIPRNIDYYLKRTSHGSTLSRVVHAWVLARSDRERSWKLFGEALESDVSDIQGGTTPEGIHLGAMAGVADLVKRCWTGLDARGDCLVFDPALPAELARLAMQIRYRGHTIGLELTRDRLRLCSHQGTGRPIRVVASGHRFELSAGETRDVPLG